MNVDALNEQPEVDAERLLSHCCGARAWVRGMLAGRPYEDEAAFQARCKETFDALTPEDWREAFAHHPRIGDLASLRAKFASTAHLTSKEQAGVSNADEETLLALKDRNDEYFKRFGYIFIIFATGKSARAMLTALEARLGNEPAVELQIAAVEQRKITQIRVEKSFA